ncbi:MAG: darcynin [Alphaproteobacteria bacterium]|nr:MAG: darcynin [Alphaproteobacteria bacterium]
MTANKPSDEPKRISFTIFMLVRTLPTWLLLRPEQRFDFLRNEINPILARHPKVAMRFFDCEAYNARVSDVIVWETASLEQYQSLVEHLRESRFWGTYFDIVEILPSLENAYAAHYNVSPVGM